MKATSCLCLHPQLLCKDLIEKEKKTHKISSFQSSAKSETQMYQNDENPCRSGNDCVSLLQTEGEINSEENAKKPKEWGFFPDSVHYEVQSASALADTEKCIQPA